VEKGWGPVGRESPGRKGGRGKDGKPRGSQYSQEEAEAAREVMDRAIRRLNALEYVILLAALILALVGGALVAWFLDISLGLPFRWSWVGASLLLFIVPGGFTYLRERRNRPRISNRNANKEPKDPHG
jgi:hypothetical protein